MDTGIDDNGNGVLDPGEVDATQYVCNGAPGATGDTGTTGATGDTGSAGLNAVLLISDEPIGSHCPLGGIKIESGLDSNGNGDLDAGEITQTSYVCAGGLPGALYAMDSSEAVYTVDPSTGATTYLADINYDSCADGCSDPLDYVDSMAYDPDTRTLFAGSGQNSSYTPGSFFTVDPGNGFATVLHDGSSDGYDQVNGMAVRNDHTLFAVVQGSDISPTLVTVDRITGQPTTVGTLDVSGFGDALTFDDSGATLYLADGGNLLVIDPANGTVLSTMPMTFLGFPSDALCDNGIVSMTTVGEGVAFGIVDNDVSFGCDISTRRFLAQINLATAEVTNVGETLSNLDGLAFAPIPLPPSRRLFLGDDDVSLALPIGFTFNFYGSDYSQFYISSNGFIGFSAGMDNGCCVSMVIPTTDVPNNLIALAWTDLNPPMGGTIIYRTAGTAPNRMLVVSFIGVPWYGSSDPNVTTQAILYEGTNVIEIHTTQQDAGEAYTQGIENVDGTAAAYATYNNGVSDVPRVDVDFSLTDDAVRFTPDGAGGYTVSSIPFAPIAP